MARSGNGTSDKIKVAGADLSSYNKVTVSFWLYANSFPNAFNVGLLYDDASDLQHNYFGIYQSTTNGGGGKATVQFADATAVNYWSDYFTPPSTGAWHHWMVTMDRATPGNAVWIDGVSQSLTTVVHNSTTYGNFGASLNYYLLGQDTSGHFASGRVAEAAVWGGVKFGTAQAQALAAGASVWEIGTTAAAPELYLPLLGDSTESDWSGRRSRTVTLTGTSIVNGPPCRTGLAVRRRAS